MGHQRLGKLPASRAWRELVACIVSGKESVAELADRVLEASEKSLNKASNDPAFKEAVYLLCKIPLAAQADDLALALAQLDIHIPTNPTRTDIIVGFERAIEKVQRGGSNDITDLSEIAKQAAISALNSLLTKPPPTPQLDLWKKPVEGVHLALKHCATPEGFADLAQSFFARFGENNIRYYLDRQLPKHLGGDGFIKSIPDMTLFDQNNRQHNKEAALIMRFYAKEWYAKVNYHEKKKLTPKDTAGFAHVAISKLRKEYRIRNAANATL